MTKNCNVCQKNFTKVIRLPIDYDCCNNTICKSCVNKHIKNQKSVNCPLCETNKSFKFFQDHKISITKSSYDSMNQEIKTKDDEIKSRYLSSFYNSLEEISKVTNFLGNVLPRLCLHLYLKFGLRWYSAFLLETEDFNRRMCEDVRNLIENNKKNFDIFLKSNVNLEMIEGEIISKSKLKSLSRRDQSLSIDENIFMQAVPELQKFEFQYRDKKISSEFLPLNLFSLLISDIIEEYPLTIIGIRDRILLNFIDLVQKKMKLQEEIDKDSELKSFYETEDGMIVRSHLTKHLTSLKKCQLSIMIDFFITLKDDEKYQDYNLYHPEKIKCSRCKRLRQLYISSLVTRCRNCDQKFDADSTELTQETYEELIDADNDISFKAYDYYLQKYEEYFNSISEPSKLFHKPEKLKIEIRLKEIIKLISYSFIKSLSISNESEYLYMRISEKHRMQKPENDRNAKEFHDYVQKRWLPFYDHHAKKFFWTFQRTKRKDIINYLKVSEFENKQNANFRILSFLDDEGSELICDHPIVHKYISKMIKGILGQGEETFGGISLNDKEKEEIFQNIIRNRIIWSNLEKFENMNTHVMINLIREKLILQISYIIRDLDIYQFKDKINNLLKPFNKKYEKSLREIFSKSEEMKYLSDEMIIPNKLEREGLFLYTICPFTQLLKLVIH